MPLTVPLKSLIVVVCLGLTVALSVASLAITLSTAADAIEGIAQDYVSASVARTTAMIQKNFQASVVGLQYVQNWASRQNISSPAEARAHKTGSRLTMDPDEGLEWLDMFSALHQQGQFKRENQLGVTFNDGTAYGMGQVMGLPGVVGSLRGQHEGGDGAIIALYSLFLHAPVTAQNPTGLVMVHSESLRWENPPVSIHQQYNLPNATMFPRPMMLRWSDLERVLSLSLTLFGPVFNARGEEFGYVFSEMSVGTFDGVLRAFPRPAGANIYLISNDGRVIGSTLGDGAVQRIFANETDSYDGDVAGECISVEEVSLEGSYEAFLCVKHALNFHPTLAELWRSRHLQGTHDDAYTGEVDGMYVGIRPIVTVSQEQAQIPNMHWKVVMLYDKAVVHEDLRRGQDISIGVVAGIAVVCLGLAIAMVHVVMKPLEVVAEDMERVATMQNLSDTTAPVFSNLAEVYSVQKSFVTLKNHLVLIRSYLPHTLLLKLDRGENPDDFGAASEEEDEVHEESLTSIASSRRASQSTDGRGALVETLSDATPTPHDRSSRSSTGTLVSAVSGPHHAQSPSSAMQKASASNCSSGTISRESSFGGKPGRLVMLHLTAVVPSGDAPADNPMSHPAGRRLSSLVATSVPTQRWADMLVVRRRSSARSESPVPGLPKLVTRKKATILAVNIRDFHAGTGDGFAQQYEVVTEQLYDVVVDNGGAIVTFSGDHFVISFNAVTPVGSHCQHACKTALALQKLFEHNDGTGRSALSAGIATGSVTVGNLGCQDMKKTQVIGAAYTQATVCERLCKLYPDVNILATKAVTRDACGFVEFQNVDIVDLPKARRCVISAVMGMKQAGAADEWMYQMQDSEDRSPFAAINRGFELYMAGDTEKARKLVSAAPEEHGELVGLAQLRTLLLHHPDEGRTYVNDMSTFFTTCMS